MHKTILLFCEGISFGHVVRCLTVGSWLQSLNIPITVACPERHRGVFRDAGFDICPITIQDPKKLYARLIEGRTIYETAELLEYFEADNELLARLSPSLLVADFRFTILQLAKQQGIPSVGITSACCHPNYSISGSTPDCFVRPRFVPVGFVDFLHDSWLGRVIQRQVIKSASIPYRRASSSFGLPVLANFFHYASQGDLCLLADHPDIFPVSPLRPGDEYVGALIWYRDEALPQAIHELTPDKKKIYLTFGTQESLKLASIGEIVEGLLKKDYSVILSKGGRDLDVPTSHDDLVVCDFVNESKLLPLVDLYVHPGGGLSTYHGIFFGVPMLTIPAHSDQHFHGQALERYGNGALVRPVEFSVKRFLNLVDELLSRKRVQECVKAAQSTLREFQPRERVLERVTDLMASS